LGKDLIAFKKEPFPQLGSKTESGLFVVARRELEEKDLWDIHRAISSGV